MTEGLAHKTDRSVVYVHCTNVCYTNEHYWRTEEIDPPFDLTSNHILYVCITLRVTEHTRPTIQ